MEERLFLRQTLIDTQLSTSKSGNGWEVLITTYALAQGDGRDRKFFRQIHWDVGDVFCWSGFSADAPFMLDLYFR